MFFPEPILREAFKAMTKRHESSTKVWESPSISTGTVSWTFGDEEEFFAEYNSGVGSASIAAAVIAPKIDGYGGFPGYELTMRFSYSHGTSSVAFNGTRDEVLRSFAVFRNAVEACRLPDPPAPALPVIPTLPPLKIFIGHGRSQHYRDLKDSLQDHHKYEVETFETSPRGGFTIPEVIEGMAQRSTLALLVMTAEDEQADGSIRARENVVHEIGYFQGRLGRKRAIVIMENGVNEFSNMHGIVHLPYKNIREVVGDVLAIIKREFPHLAK